MRRISIRSDRLISLYHKYKSSTLTAKAVGCSPSLVVQRLNLLGVSLCYMGHKDHVWNKIDLDEPAVIAYYRKVRSLRRTAKHFKCSTPTIVKVLKKYSIPRDGKATFTAKRRRRLSESMRLNHIAGKFRGKYHWNWQGGKHVVMCCICGVKMERYYDSARPVCSLECNAERVSIDLRGEKSYMWKGGKNLYPYGWRNTLRDAIRRRDGYRCCLCRKAQKQDEDRLCVHHIDYDKDNLDSKNLISLCRSCHSKTNMGTRQAWTIYFESMKRKARSA